MHLLVNTYPFMALGTLSGRPFMPCKKKLYHFLPIGVKGHTMDFFLNVIESTSPLMLGVDQQNVRGSRKVTWVSPFPALSPVDRIVFGQNSVLKLHVKTQWMDEWFNFVMNPM